MSTTAGRRTEEPEEFGAELGRESPLGKQSGDSTGDRGRYLNLTDMPSTADTTSSEVSAGRSRRNRSGFKTATPAGRDRTGKSRMLLVTRWVASVPIATVRTCRSLS